MGSAAIKSQVRPEALYSTSLPVRVGYTETAHHMETEGTSPESISDYCKPCIPAYVLLVTECTFIDIEQCKQWYLF